MDEIHKAVGPHPGFAHRLTQGRGLQPGHELVQQSPPALCATGIDVERLTVPDYAFALHFKPLLGPVAVTVDRDRSSYRNGPFLETRPLSSGRWRQCDIPDFAICAY